MGGDVDAELLEPFTLVTWSFQAHFQRRIARGQLVDVPGAGLSSDEGCFMIS